MEIYTPNQMLDFDKQVKDVLAEVKRNGPVLATINGVRVPVTANADFKRVVYLYNKFSIEQYLTVENFYKKWGC